MSLGSCENSHHPQHHIKWRFIVMLPRIAGTCVPSAWEPGVVSSVFCPLSPADIFPLPHPSREQVVPSSFAVWVPAAQFYGSTKKKIMKAFSLWFCTAKFGCWSWTHSRLSARFPPSSCHGIVLTHNKNRQHSSC